MTSVCNSWDGILAGQGWVPGSVWAWVWGVCVWADLQRRPESCAAREGLWYCNFAPGYRPIYHQQSLPSWVTELNSYIQSGKARIQYHQHQDSKYTHPR
ncbi:hypothetical protein WAI453_009348 [Rhynchosporium graminicola]